MKRIASFEKVSENHFLESGRSKEEYDNILLPKRATKASAGYDFYAPFAFSLNPNETIKIPTGIRVKMEPNYVLMLFPRSSLGFKYSLQLNNTVGIIDADYYEALNGGHIFIKMTNHSDKVLEIKAQEAFAQGIFLEYGITIDDDVETNRIGGMGSTNKNL